MSHSPSGILNLHKPVGITSRDVVNQVVRNLGFKKIGHAGTLDPLASGVLVLCLGRATRLIEYIQQQKKVYEGVFRLGCTSDTEDIEGEVVDLIEPPIPSLAQLQTALPRFQGNILQRPPAYSAKKVAGRRAYQLARAGAEVELPEVPVTIYDLEIEKYDYPSLHLSIGCGSGTYIRSLGRDLAASVGSGAVMTSLVRTAIGPFYLDTAVAPEDVTSDRLSELLLPTHLAVGHLPRLEIADAVATRLCMGQKISLADIAESEPESQQISGDIAVFAHSCPSQLQAIAIWQQGVLKPKRVFATA